MRLEVARLLLPCFTSASLADRGPRRRAESGVEMTEAPDRSEEWAALRLHYLRSRGERPRSAGGGVHHFALVCSDVERTIRFYSELLEFPLVELFENRDYPGSTHLFFDVGLDNYLAFFDFPGLDLG